MQVIQHEWPGLYALQFNWALDNCPITAEWVLRLDADEWFMPEALEELKAKLPALPRTSPESSTSAGIFSWAGG